MGMANSPCAPSAPSQSILRVQSCADETAGAHPSASPHSPSPRLASGMRSRSSGDSRTAARSLGVGELSSRRDSSVGWGASSTVETTSEESLSVQEQMQARFFRKEAPILGSGIRGGSMPVDARARTAAAAGPLLGAPLASSPAPEQPQSVADPVLEALAAAAQKEVGRFVGRLKIPGGATFVGNVLTTCEGVCVYAEDDAEGRVEYRGEWDGQREDGVPHGLGVMRLEPKPSTLNPAC